MRQSLEWKARVPSSLIPRLEAMENWAGPGNEARY